MLILKVHLEGHEVLRLPINRELCIGRGTNNDLVLDDPKASRCHARICPESDSAILCDLESRNGTIVNGVKIAEVRLRAGESFSIASTYCEVVSEEITSTGFSLDKYQDQGPSSDDTSTRGEPN